MLVFLSAVSMLLQIPWSLSWPNSGQFDATFDASCNGQVDMPRAANKQEGNGDEGNKETRENVFAGRRAENLPCQRDYHFRKKHYMQPVNYVRHFCSRITGTATAPRSHCEILSKKLPSRLMDVFGLVWAILRPFEKRQIMARTFFELASQAKRGQVRRAKGGGGNYSSSP